MIALLTGAIRPAAADPTWTPKPAPLSTPWTDQVGPDNALPEYPRPQLARPSAAAPRWMNLNGVWQYAAAGATSAAPIGQSLPQRILVPYPIESALSGIQQHSDYMYYRRTFTVPSSYRRHGQHVRLNFGAVSHEAAVWVNGELVGSHSGGYDAFSIDITAALFDGAGRQEIVVGVHAPVDGATIPVGKQRLQPGGIFYTAASGIWQTVWLEPVPATNIAALTATPDLATSTMQVTTRISGDPHRAVVRVKILKGRRTVATASGAAGAPLTLALPHPRLWSPADPFLYTIAASVTRKGVTDRVESYAGMRSIGLAVVDGKQRIVLNGKPTFLLATLDQGYWPDGIYTAPTDAALKFDLQKTKDLGFNTIRKHIKVEPARWYYYADRLGLMVWQDMPALPTGRNDRLTDTDKATFENELTRMVAQLQSVTSIIGWIPFNEGWGQWSVAAAADVAARVKAQDPSRLVDERSGLNCCDTAGDAGGGDVIDWHVYVGPALPAPDAHRAAIDGEHGGFSLGIEGHTWPGASINPYGAVKDRAALNDAYVANTAILRDEGAPFGLSGSVYTQITDVENELNGLFTYDRRVEKVDEARVRTINQQTIAAGAAPTPALPPGTPGLVGTTHWTFDEGAGPVAADSSGNHHDLALVGGPTWVPGHAGTAVHFDGGNQYGDAGRQLINTGRANYSVAAWVRMDALGRFQTVVSQDGENNSAFFLQYSAADNAFAFSTSQVRAVATTVGQPVVGRWYHLVGVRSLADGQMRIYVNGQLSGTAYVLFGDPSTGNTVVGRGKFGGKPVDFLAGSVDDVHLYDR
ncbi:MAG: glycoside hydrolase family 2, partial [Actinomycetota bacterium]|nr:glycoside hydrolase family 2 [Actinomycetota bacterium]